MIGAFAEHELPSLCYDVLVQALYECLLNVGSFLDLSLRTVAGRELRVLCWGGLAQGSVKIFYKPLQSKTVLVQDCQAVHKHSPCCHLSLPQTDEKGPRPLQVLASPELY